MTTIHNDLTIVTIIMIIFTIAMFLMTLYYDRPKPKKRRSR